MDADRTAAMHGGDRRRTRTRRSLRDHDENEVTRATEGIRVMTTPFPITVDDPGIQTILNAFQTADGVVKAVRSSVSGAEAALQWNGDASTVYRNSLAGWLDGLSQVETGLHNLDDAMHTHQQSTNVAEDTARGSSTWYRG
jgi:uncharacterized protein YukE